MTSTSDLTFLGAAGTVTGSKSLLRLGGETILVDCGLFQGLKQLRLMNWEPAPIPIRDLDLVLVTHAHLDHIGYLPVLVRMGYRGPIYCTEPTRELAEVLLLDSAKIQEEDAERANRKEYTKHHPAKALYTVEDVHQTIKLFQGMPYKTYRDTPAGNRFCFHNAGHILGSAWLSIEGQEQRIVFSGDLGRRNSLLLEAPDPIPEADYIICESTYGDRLHDTADPLDVMRHAILEHAMQGDHGVLLIPTFTVERAQELLFLLGQLRQEGTLPNYPIYLDSPMGVDVSEIMARNCGYLKLSEAQCRNMFQQVRWIRDVQQSKAVVQDSGRKIVLAGSGMIEGGRILHYLDKYLDDPHSSILMVGYQAVGTRGRNLLDGASELKFFGSFHPVRARVHSITSLSGHGDRDDLIAWLKTCPHAPQRIFLNHGESQASDALRVKLTQDTGWSVEVARPLVRYELSPTSSV